MRNQLLLILILLLSSCGPTYNTNQEYLPLKTQMELTCTQTCKNTQNSCEALEQQRYQHCEQMSEMRYQNCRLSRVERYNSQKKKMECIRNCHCSQDYCPEADLAGCQSAYDQCYVDCGGEIKATTFCVSSCETAVPTHTYIINKRGRVVVDN